VYIYIWYNTTQSCFIEPEISKEKAPERTGIHILYSFC